MTDEELVLSCRTGDKASWEELYKRYNSKVLAIARRFFLSGGETEDLVQEGMCGLYSAVNGYREGSNFSAYAISCIKNRIVDAVKKCSGAKYSALNNFAPISEVGEEIYYSNDSPEDELIMREDKREILQLMSKVLSPLEFKSLVMYTEGMSMAEISSAVGKPAKSVDNALNRAKNKLQKTIFSEE